MQTTVTPPEVQPAPGVPCAKCQTTGGLRSHKNSSGPPHRYNAKQFGFEGRLCKTCYARESRWRKAAQQGREPGKMGRHPKPILPCVKCGTLGGHARRGKPARYRTDSYGRPGPFCGGCWARVYQEKKAADKARDLRDDEQVAYLPDEAMIAKRARAVRLLVLGGGVVRPEEWEVERAVNGERARVERERAKVGRMPVWAAKSLRPTAGSAGVSC